MGTLINLILLGHMLASPLGQAQNLELDKTALAAVQFIAALRADQANWRNHAPGYLESPTAVANDFVYILNGKKISRQQQLEGLRQTFPQDWVMENFVVTFDYPYPSGVKFSYTTFRHDLLLNKKKTWSSYVTASYQYTNGSWIFAKLESHKAQ